MSIEMIFAEAVLYVEGFSPHLHQATSLDPETELRIALLVYSCINSY